MGDVQGVPTSAYLAMADALAEAPRDAGDRFAGTPHVCNRALAARMRGMFGVVPRRSDEWLMFDKAAVLGLADDLDERRAALVARAVLGGAGVAD